MKKTGALVSGLVLTFTLLGGMVIAQELGPGEVIRVEGAAYCHMKFPAAREDSLSWANPVFDEGAVHAIDYYGSCDYDPLGIDEIEAQQRVILRGIYGEGE